jgi:hypothetical protein
MPAELRTLSKRENMSSDTGLEELDLELSIRIGFACRISW